MSTLYKLQKEKDIILSAISKAASEGETDAVLAESEKLEKIENLISRHNHIISEFESLRSGTQGIAQKKTRRIVDTPVGKSRSMQMVASRELGEKMRSEFLSKREAEGVPLQLVKGRAIFRTRSGKRVGLAVATERQPNRWFLGLPADGFDHAVLLCQREDGAVIDIPLPERFFEKYGRAMSVSKGQLKFNIVYRDSGPLVKVPRIGEINVKSFAKDYSFLS